ncbi:DUF484 family protein [Kiloniella sp. b19]|uniref:DUF484 family protein n=1 Tax=Kiloniella sp. GXU_MW_B19 TaxID=3141326 RepID=UPI0031D072B3
MTNDSHPQPIDNEAQISSATPEDKTVSPQDVLAFLQRNPDFLIAHPDLLLKLDLPGRSQEDRQGKGSDLALVDFQTVRIERLKHEIALLQKERDLVISRSHHNKLTQDRAHRAVLALMQTQSLEDFFVCLSEDLPLLLSMDTVVIASEEPSAPGGVVPLPEGAINGLLGSNRSLSLHNDIDGSPLLYGRDAPLVHSEALVRLSPSAGAGATLLAFGSFQSDQFHPEQGTELLRFLTLIVECCLHRWLELSE